jgi:hypothetical protein
MSEDADNASEVSAMVTVADFEHGLGAVTVGCSTLPGITVVAATSSNPRHKRVQIENHPTVPQRVCKADIAFVSKWTRLSKQGVAREPKCIVSTVQPTDDLLIRYRWISFDVNASYYNTPQSRVQKFFIGLANGTPEELEEVATGMRVMASSTPLMVKDRLKTVDHYFLDPAGNGRGLYSAKYPAPCLVAKHWGVVHRESYRRRLTDSWTDPCTASTLSIEEIGVLQGFPLTYKYIGSRKEVVDDLSSSVPPPVITAIVDAVLPYVLKERGRPMDAAPSTAVVSFRFEQVAEIGEIVFSECGAPPKAVYVMGTSASGDRIALDISGFKTLPEGWRVVIRTNKGSVGNTLLWQRNEGGPYIKSRRSVRKQMLADRRKKVKWD